MKKQYLKVWFLGLLITGTWYSADAQTRRGRTRGNNTTQENNTGSQQQTQQQVNNTQPPTNFNAYGNLPIEKAPVTGGFGDSVKRSLRNDAAYEKSALKDHLPFKGQYCFLYLMYK